MTHNTGVWAAPTRLLRAVRRQTTRLQYFAPRGSGIVSYEVDADCLGCVDALPCMRVSTPTEVRVTQGRDFAHRDCRVMLSGVMGCNDWDVA